MSAALALQAIPVVDKTPGKRCSDYDEDCACVPDPYFCWTGDGYWLDQADGYCPRLIGME